MVKPRAAEDNEPVLPTLLSAALAPAEEKHPTSVLEQWLKQMTQAALEGNMQLVEDRRRKIMDLCSFGAVQRKQARSKATTSTSASISAAASDVDSTKKPGGLAYRPGFMLQIIRLSDTLSLCCTPSQNNVGVLSL